MTGGGTGVGAVDTLAIWSAAAVGIAGAAALLWRATRGLRRLGRRVDEFIDDWSGEAARPGVPARPGVMARLATIEQRAAAIEHELHPNSGGSLRDAIDRVEARVTD